MSVFFMAAIKIFLIQCKFNLSTQIKFEDMKEKALETKTKKKKKRVEVAYEDSTGFGGILASKLDAVVKKDAGKAKKKKPANEKKEK